MPELFHCMLNPRGPNFEEWKHIFGTHNPGEAMVLLDQLLRFYREQYGIIAIETLENPPQ